MKVGKGSRPSLFENPIFTSLRCHVVYPIQTYVIDVNVNMMRYGFANICFIIKSKNPNRIATAVIRVGDVRVPDTPRRRRLPFFWSLPAGPRMSGIGNVTGPSR